jgi:hypothetical protein
VHESHPGAQPLRAMNLTCETSKERGATILILSSMIDFLNCSARFAQVGRSRPGANETPVSEWRRRTLPRQQVREGPVTDTRQPLSRAARDRVSAAREALSLLKPITPS